MTDEQAPEGAFSLGASDAPETETEAENTNPAPEAPEKSRGSVPPVDDDKAPEAAPAASAPPLRLVPTAFLRPVQAATLGIFGEIGGYFGTTLTTVAEWLSQNGSSPITVDISSYGGAADEALAIYEALRAAEQPITTRALGQTASAATFIFLAGETRLIAPTAGLMIHEARFSDFYSPTLTGDELERMRVQLDQINSRMATLYADRTGLDIARVRELMRVDTFFDPAEAVEMGFATGLMEADTATEASARALGARRAPRADAKQVAAKAAAAGWSELTGDLLTLSGAQADAVIAQAQTIGDLTAAHGWPRSLAVDMARARMPETLVRAILHEMLAKVSSAQEITVAKAPDQDTQPVNGFVRATEERNKRNHGGN